MQVRPAIWRGQTTAIRCQMTRNTDKQLRERWSTSEGIQRVAKVVHCLNVEKTLPRHDFSQEPVDLAGLHFPTVTLCEALALQGVTVQQVIGARPFSKVTMQNVTLRSSDLSYSTWSDSLFEHVDFSKATLDQVRFHGCEFVSCTFSRSTLTNVAFAPGPTGKLTQIRDCSFERADLRGSSWANVAVTDCAIANCYVDGVEFEEPLWRGVKLVGRYDELTYRGDGRRGAALGLDLRLADVCWLNADNGIDLSEIRLSHDSDAVVLKSRKVSVHQVCDWIVEAVPSTRKLVGLLGVMFTERSPSPLSDLQDTYFLSACMFRQLDETLSSVAARRAMDAIRVQAKRSGFLCC